jgi:phage gp36-like protein
MYLTAAEFVERFTEREAVMLSAESATQTTVDTVRLERGLTDASAVVDGYLARRFALPLQDVATLAPIVPDMIKRLTGDIARYLLTGTHVRETDAIRTRYKDAVDLLDRIATGKVSMGIELVMASSPSAPVGGASAVRSGGRMFGDEGLGGY